MTRRAEYRTYLSLLKEEQPCILDTSKGGRAQEFLVIKVTLEEHCSKVVSSFIMKPSSRHRAYIKVLSDRKSMAIARRYSTFRLAF